MQEIKEHNYLKFKKKQLCCINKPKRKNLGERIKKKEEFIVAVKRQFMRIKQFI